MMHKTLFAVLLSVSAVAAFSPAVHHKSRLAASSTHRASASLVVLAAKDEQPEEKQKGGLFSGISNFFTELDNFMDDASARRLGAGASFYGKRKSSFYGEDDKMKKSTDGYDPTEDYRVTAGGNYKWMEDEDGILRPVTRLRNKIMERD